MKQLLIIAFLFIGMIGNAQIRFISSEYFVTSIAIDPKASIEEKGVNLVGEFELISYWKYVKVNVQTFGALEGGYTDIAGGFGVNLTGGYFEGMRVYSGIRLGHIWRGDEDFPLAGLEGGFDYLLNETVFFGARGTLDYRKDFEFSGAEPGVKYSTYVRVGVKLGKPKKKKR